jgi:protein-S-isoprenylcysteine O-methyltransferase Ste14
MPLNEQLQVQGSFLFRWRGFLPLLLAPLALYAIWESRGLVGWLDEPIEEAWELLSLFIAFLGLAVRGLTVGFAPSGTSGRNTHEQRAQTLNTTGLYAIVRNPLYLGNYLVLIGIVLAIKVWWLVVIACLAFALYYERIICAEEAYLKERFGAAYVAWAAKTPAFFPNSSMIGSGATGTGPCSSSAAR